MMVHVADAVEKGHKSVMIRIADTDVVVIAVAAVVTLDVKELRVSHWTGKNNRILRSRAGRTSTHPRRSSTAHEVSHVSRRIRVGTSNYPDSNACAS